MSYRPVLTGGVVVEVPKEEYEQLLRESERLAMVRRYLERSEYPSTYDIKLIVFEERERKVEENVSE